MNKNTKYGSSSLVVHIPCTLPEKVPNTFNFLSPEEFLTRFLLHNILSFKHLSLNVLLAKQVVEF